MRVININTWNRKQLYEHFSNLKDPFFGVTISFDVTHAYNFSKEKKVSFFGRYLHDCMKALNTIENFKYRIENDKVIVYDSIHASATIMREDKTFGFSFIEYSENLSVFLNNLEVEKQRIYNSNNLYPPQNRLDCIHCSAMPWVNFSGHKEPVSGVLESVPKLAFGKATKINDRLLMNVAIAVNHALADGYHVGLFSEKFQEYLNH